MFFGIIHLVPLVHVNILIVGTNVKLNFRFVGRPIVNHCEGHNSVIRSAIEVHELLLIRFQIDLVPSQYLVGKVFKSSRHSTIVSAGSYIVVMGLLFILGILAQIGATPKEMGDTPRSPLDVLHLGHHLRRPEKASKSSWRPNPCQVRVYFGLQEQPALKQTPRSHT